MSLKPKILKCTLKTLKRYFIASPFSLLYPLLRSFKKYFQVHSNSDFTIKLFRHKGNFRYWCKDSSNGWVKQMFFVIHSRYVSSIRFKIQYQYHTITSRFVSFNTYKDILYKNTLRIVIRKLLYYLSLFHYVINNYLNQY